MEYGGIEVETPIMYDTKHPSLQSYFNRFPARQYNITSDNKQLFLRFAACFGQFLMAKDFNISYKDRKSTRLNSSHANISYAVFCLKKKNNTLTPVTLSLARQNQRTEALTHAPERCKKITSISSFWAVGRSEQNTSELQSRKNLVVR